LQELRIIAVVVTVRVSVGSVGKELTLSLTFTLPLQRMRSEVMLLMCSKVMLLIRSEVMLLVFALDVGVLLHRMCRGYRLWDNGVGFTDAQRIIAGFIALRISVGIAL
jgi:hypothetical protein